MQHLEQITHEAIVGHLRLRQRADVMWWHCASGERRDKRAAARLKRMGVRPGVPDITGLIPVIGQPPLFFAIEVKSATGRLSKPQREFIDSVNALGGVAAVVSSVDEGVRFLEEWGALKPRVGA